MVDELTFSPWNRNDKVVSMLGMALFVLSIGYAIDLNNGFYRRQALLWLTVSLACAISALMLSAFETKRLSSRSLVVVLVTGIAIETVLLLESSEVQHLARAAFVAIVAVPILGLLQLLDLERFRIPLVVVVAATFFYAGQSVINSFPNPRDDVRSWQQATSAALLAGKNPYQVRIFSPWGPHGQNTSFYGAGIVDQNGYLTCALPYPPLSLLMVVPAYVMGNDIRYAQLLAMVLSAALMGMAAPTSGDRRIGALVGVVFLLTPRVFFTLWEGWTEPLMMLNFSLVMFCARRWWKGLPWALGLFLATKQYSVLALPLLPLLLHGPERWKQLRAIVTKAGILVAVINLPFLLWHVHQFIRAVILLRVMPPFRADALSYLVWIYSLTGRIPPTWVGVPVAAAAAALVLWKGTRSPAGFAAGVTLVTTLFFAFGKQAFCNYYYFTIGTACWSLAAANLPLSFAWSHTVIPSSPA